MTFGFVDYLDGISLERTQSSDLPALENERALYDALGGLNFETLRSQEFGPPMTCDELIASLERSFLGKLH